VKKISTLRIKNDSKRKKRRHVEERRHLEEDWQREAARNTERLARERGLLRSVTRKMKLAREIDGRIGL
jgi:hypothetical protein